MKLLFCLLLAALFSCTFTFGQYVTTNTNETITGIKTFSPTVSGSGAGVIINPAFTVTGPGQLYGLDVALPVVSNPNGYAISAKSARFRGGIMVNSAAEVDVLRTNQIIRNSDIAFVFDKAGSANVASQLVFRQTRGATETSNLVNSTLFLDSVFFNANTTAEGYSHVRLTPALTQTGYTGITRGLFVNPLLTGVTNFRAVETNVNRGNGYQIYAGGTAGNYFKGTTAIDSNWVFNNSLSIGENFYTNNIQPRVTNSPIVIAKPTTAMVSLARVATSSTIYPTSNVMRTGFGFIDSIQWNNIASAQDFAAIRVNSILEFTGSTSGVVRGLFIEPSLTNITNFRSVETSNNAGTGYQIYAGGTAASYFGGGVGIGTTDTKGYQLAIAGNAVVERIVVKKQENWPDYVFDSSYRLTPLADVDKYIWQYKHLPGVPSAAEVKREGLNLGDNQAVLLKKIEELTLYVIEHNKQLETQKQHRSALESRLIALEKRLLK